MKIRGILAAFLVVLVICVVLSVLAVETKSVADVDVVAINEVVKTIEGHWEHLERGDYSAIRQPFTVLDNSGNVIYQTSGASPATINEAIRNRDTLVDITQDHRIVGKLIVHNGDKGIVKHMKEQLMAILIVTFAVLTVLCILYMWHIHHVVFRPFNRLQSFAVHVARGNLDIPIRITKNNPFGAFTESFDMMREELAAARRSEAAANRSKKELVATLSHDIKTPVASIKAMSELMLMQATDGKAIKQLNTLYAKAEQIDRLVTDMFHATLEELQELQVTAAEESSTILDGMIQSMNFDNQISYDPIPGCLILADRLRLQQVLDNIISNSYKYAGTAVTITSRISQRYLELYIMDYGQGIGGDELPLLFNKFYRGKNAEGRSGTGLGLYISKYFMENMQGDIECHNRDDGFTVILRIKLA